MHNLGYVEQRCANYRLDPQGVKPKAEVIADILASIKARRA